jgi:proteasome lid subunit RPN8/RPN11
LKSNQEYCGFVCGFALEDIQKVLDEIKQFSEYNPEFAREMLDKIIAQINDTRAQLAPVVVGTGA